MVFSGKRETGAGVGGSCAGVSNPEVRSDVLRPLPNDCSVSGHLDREREKTRSYKKEQYRIGHSVV